jgi:hypothetical protein
MGEPILEGAVASAFYIDSFSEYKVDVDKKEHQREVGGVVKGCYQPPHESSHSENDLMYSPESFMHST